MKATLQDVHGLLSEEMRERLREIQTARAAGEPYRALTAGEINAMSRFLKDNGIEAADGADTSALKEAADGLRDYKAAVERGEIPEDREDIAEV